MTNYRGLSAQDLEDQYDLAGRRSDFQTSIVENWLERSEAFRNIAVAELNLSFGDDPRDLVDLFSGGNKDAPLLVFLHGGYWQRGSKDMYSFIAEPFVKHGISVAVAEYNLCPSVRVGDISKQMHRLMIWLWQNAGHYDYSADKICLSGASAGGHLTAMLLSSDWTELGAGLPRNLIDSAILISGVYDMEPIRLSSINNALDLNQAESLQQSPLFKIQPFNTRQLVAVGGAETDEFLRQSSTYCSKFRTSEREIDLHIDTDVDHFDILNSWTNDSTEFFRKSCALITGAPGSGRVVR